MIVNIPIEPIAQRYSADWNRWFDKAFSELNFIEGVDYVQILPETLTSNIRDGAFLDVVGTTYFKSSQLAKIAQLADQGVIPRNGRVVFLIHDGWFPVEQIAYMRDMLGCYDWRIVGLFHAGTYDPWDQLAQHKMYTWGEDLENSWFKIYDKIVVASNYHKQLLLDTRQILNHKIEVIPWKVEVPDIRMYYNAKQDWVIFPHRHNPEKLAFPYSNMIDVSPYHWIDPNTISATSEQAKIEGKLKDRYYDLLARSKICVSFSLQETFGIAMVESVLSNCIPLVPDKLSYKEMYPDCFRYKDEKEFKWKLAEMMNDADDYLPTVFDLRETFKHTSSMFFPRLFNLLETV